jgi:hypothetical protein
LVSLSELKKNDLKFVIKTRLDYFPWIEEQRARKRQIESDNITLLFCAFSLGLGVEISA